MREASTTAQMVAAFRGRANAREDPLCNDRWASRLAGEDGVALADSMAEAKPHLELWVALRTAFLDRQVQGYSKETPQVIVLGAGLDTRAARLARDGVRFFEVDHPDSQALKRARLAELEDYPVDAATYVACDFEHDDFLDRLKAEGFELDLPAVFLWEGVTMYLSEEAVRATLERVATCHPKSVLLFDYVNKNMAQGTRLDTTDAAARSLIAEAGEPMVFGLNDPLPMLAAAGFRHVRTTSFDEICLSLTGTYERERRFRFQRIALASRDQARSFYE